MLGNAPFSHNILRKYQAAFGTLFNEIQIVRRDADGALQQTINVPLSYSRKDKLLARLAGDPTLEKQAALVLPRMSFELVSLEYDEDRKLRSTRPFKVVQSDPGHRKIVLNPVPYNLHFNLYVYAKYQADGNQVVEQILPFFTPQFDITIILIPEMDIRVDAPVVVSAPPTCEDTYDGAYTERRAIIWTLPFVMKAYLFGPVRVHPVIKFANVNFYDSTLFDNIADAVGNSSPIDRVTLQPGQAPDGSATKSLRITVPFSEIDKDEDWDYVTTVAGNLDPSEGTGGENPQVRAAGRTVYVGGKAANLRASNT